MKLTTGQRRESYDGVHYSDLTYDAFAQVAVNLVVHLERTGTIGAAAASSSSPEKPFVKNVSGMGNILLGLMVVFLASVMVLTRDAYHGTVRLAMALIGGRYIDPESLSWERTYGGLLRKIGKHPDGPGPALASPSSVPGGGSGAGGGGGVEEGRGGMVKRDRGRSSAQADEEEVEKLLLADERERNAERGSLEMTGTRHSA